MRGNMSILAVRIAKTSASTALVGSGKKKSAMRARAGLGSAVSPLHATSIRPLPPSPLKTHVSFDSGNEKTLGNSCLVLQYGR